MTLDGRVALVTGASRGIGADIAKYLARAGASVAVTARSEVERDPRLPGTVHSVADEIKAGGGQAVGIRVDMRDDEGIFAGVERAVDEFGGSTSSSTTRRCRSRARSRRWSRGTSS